MDVLFIVFSLFPIVSSEEEMNQTIYQYRYYSILLLFNVIAWVSCAKLMAYEYRKRLSEDWPTWCFWVVMAMIKISFFIVNLNLYVIMNSKYYKLI